MPGYLNVSLCQILPTRSGRPTANLFAEIRWTGCQATILPTMSCGVTGTPQSPLSERWQSPADFAAVRSTAYEYKVVRQQWRLRKLVILVTIQHAGHVLVPLQQKYKCLYYHSSSVIRGWEILSTNSALILIIDARLTVGARDTFRGCHALSGQAAKGFTPNTVYSGRACGAIRSYNIRESFFDPLCSY